MDMGNTCKFVSQYLLKEIKMADIKDRAREYLA
jgi:hypothetical protein